MPLDWLDVPTTRLYRAYACALPCSTSLQAQSFKLHVVLQETGPVDYETVIRVNDVRRRAPDPFQGDRRKPHMHLNADLLRPDCTWLQFPTLVQNVLELPKIENLAIRD